MRSAFSAFDSLFAAPLIVRRLAQRILRRIQEASLGARPPPLHATPSAERLQVAGIAGRELRSSLAACQRCVAATRPWAEEDSTCQDG